MRVLTYRKTDGVVFWVGDSGSPDYIDPVMRDDLQQCLRAQPSPMDKWYEKWYVTRENGLILTMGEEPDDANGIRLWRSKVVTLNMLAAAVNLVRQRVLPPMDMQADVYQWKHVQAGQDEATLAPNMLSTYRTAQGLSQNEARAIVVMKDQQFFAAIAKSEEKREEIKAQILVAVSAREIETIRTGINKWIGQ